MAHHDSRYRRLYLKRRVSEDLWCWHNRLAKRPELVAEERTFQDVQKIVRRFNERRSNLV